MEPVGSLPHSQVPTKYPCPESARSSQYPSSYFPKIHLNIPSTPWVFQVVSFPQVSPPQPCIRLSSPPYVMHVLFVCPFRKKIRFFAARICYNLAQPPSQRTTPCRPSAIVYSIYSHLPFILEVVPPSET